jgi:hypothetical protein
MADDLAVTLYRRLIALYPRAFRERLAESMLQTFRDARSNGRSVLALFAGTAMGAAAEHISSINRGPAMKPAPAAFLSLALLAPFIAAFFVASLQIEPLHGLIRDLGTSPDGRTNPAGYAVQLGMLLLVIAAGLVSGFSVARTVRTAGHPFANLSNLAIAGICALLLSGLAIVIVVDQLPCWMGEPNCD